MGLTEVEPAISKFFRSTIYCVTNPSYSKEWINKNTPDVCVNCSMRIKCEVQSG